MKDPLALYTEYHVRRQDERAGLFDVLRRELAIESCLYPGCFVHVTPSFFFPVVTYVDSDARARSFFSDPRVLALVEGRRVYDRTPQITFLAQDYRQPLEVGREVDLLVSQYAGFVSEAGKRHVRPGGYLVANNSHGDASLASLDPEWKLVAVADRRGERFRYSDRRLGEYFVPKSGVPVTRESLERTRRGVAYTRSASNYVFVKVSPDD